MRALKIAATTAAALAFAGAAYAQDAATKPSAQPPAAQSQGAAGGQQGGGAQVQSLNIVDVSELPAATQKKVNDVASKAKPDDVQKMHASIDASPQIKQALAQKGLSSKDVIVANLTPDGALTLVTKKAT